MPASRVGVLRRLRVRVPNTRLGALVVVLCLLSAGFAIGVGLLVVVPMVRSGQGIFALLNRGARPPADVRSRLPSQLQATPLPERPELWLTPVGSLAFPSVGAFGDLSGAVGSASVTYDPRVTNPVLALPPIRDALGRPVVSALVTFGADDAPATPGPNQPSAVEATQLTLGASVGSNAQLDACVLAMREGVLQAVEGIGVATVADCRSGTLRLASGGALSFAVQYDKLPNFRARDGIWRAGGVLGKTVVRVALRASAAG